MTSKKNNANRFMEELGAQPEPSPAPSGPLPGAAQIFPGKPVNLAIPSQGNALVKDGQIKIGGFVLTGTGLQVTGAATKQDWSQVGELLFKLEGSIQWLIGDWLAYGEDVKYGEREALAKELGRPEQALYDYAYVSRQVQFSCRHENLSYTHHVLVAKLEPQDQMTALAYAAEAGLSAMAFRKWLKEWTGQAQKQPSAPSTGPTFEEASRDLDKYMRIDPAAWKPKDRTLFLGRIAEMERLLAEAKRHAGIE